MMQRIPKWSILVYLHNEPSRQFNIFANSVPHAMQILLSFEFPLNSYKIEITRLED